MLNSMSPYILFGFLLAGVLHEFMPKKFYTRYLSGQGFKSVVLSALFGVPMPLCSCGVIPAAMGLRKEGVSRGATAAFLIATPQTGVDSLVASYCLMGLPFALIRPVAALLTAIFGGSLINHFAPQADEAVTSAQATENAIKTMGIGHRLLAVLRYSMIDMMQDIGKWLLIGLLIAGIITAALPDEWFAMFQGNSLLSMLAILLCCIPMYLCATGSIPIAVALMMKGLSPGTALVLLMAGPSCNMASILVVRKVLGQRTMVLYLAAIVMGAVVCGLGIDYLLPAEWFTSHLLYKDICCETPARWLYQSCTVLLVGLLLYALVISRLMGRHHHHCHCHEQESEKGHCCHCHHHEE